MLSARGTRLAGAAALLVFLGAVPLAGRGAALGLAGLALVFYLLFEYAAFCRHAATLSNAVVKRELLQGGRSVPTLWAGVPATVRLTVTPPAAGRHVRVHLTDWRPADLPRVEAVAPATGSFEAVFTLSPGAEPVVLEYDLGAPSLGVIRFEGVRLGVTDHGGLFEGDVTRPDGREYAVLPRVAPAKQAARGRKGLNRLPPPGVHRLLRPGLGDELLDLRDYRPGDEPKMIAWKASARKDTLITKEIESDVPLRLTVVIDHSAPTHAGDVGGTVGARLAGPAARVIQTAAAHRDLVGLVLADEAGFERVAPARTRQHPWDLIRRMVAALSRPPELPRLPASAWLALAEPFARALAPQAFTRERNRTPLGLFWAPVSDSGWFYVVLGLLATPMLAFGLFPGEALEFLADVSGAITADYRWVPFLVLSALPSWLAASVWLVYGSRGLYPPTARRVRRRKQVALVIADEEGSNAARIDRLVADDREFADAARAFLARHRVRLGRAAPARPEAGRGKFLAAGLGRAVAAAKDDEVFVLFAAATAELAADDSLAAAVRYARARRHQVMIVLAEADAPAFDFDSPLDWKRVAAGAEERGGPREPGAALAEVRRRLGRAGASVVTLAEGDTAEWVARRLDQARAAQARQGGRR